jgi:hypothetical protein
MRSKLTEERAEEAARLVAEGLTLDAVAARLGVDRRTILRRVARDPAFRARYEQARRAAHQGLHDELREAVLRAGGSRAAAYAARRRLMRRVPKRYGRLPPEQRPRLLYPPRPPCPASRRLATGCGRDPMARDDPDVDRWLAERCCCCAGPGLVWQVLPDRPPRPRPPPVGPRE